MLISPIEQRFIAYHKNNEKARIINILNQHGSVINIKDMGDSIRAACPCGLLYGDDVLEVSEIVYLTNVQETFNWLGY